MRQQTRSSKEPAEKVVQDIRRATRKHYSAEEKIWIVLEGLRGEDSIADPKHIDTSICWMLEPHDAETPASLHTAYKCILKEGQNPRTRRRPIWHQRKLSTNVTGRATR